MPLGLFRLRDKLTHSSLWCLPTCGHGQKATPTENRCRPTSSSSGTAQSASPCFAVHHGSRSLGRGIPRCRTGVQHPDRASNASDAEHGGRPLVLLQGIPVLSSSTGIPISWYRSQPTRSRTVDRATRHFTSRSETAGRWGAVHGFAEALLQYPGRKDAERLRLKSAVYRRRFG